MSERKLIHWLYVHQAVTKLERHIRKDMPRIVKIVAISRGGMIPAVMLSHALDVRAVEAVQVQSYTKGDIRGTHPRVTSEWTGDWNWSDVLFVDDIIDTGKTFDFLVAKFPRANYCALISKMEHRAAHAIKEHPHTWVVFPWEAPYTEEMRKIRDDSDFSDGLG